MTLEMAAEIERLKKQNETSSFLTLLPGLQDEIDTKVGASETKLKLWVVTGVLVNLLAITGSSLVMAYQIGQFISQTRDVTQVVKDNQTAIRANSDWILRHEAMEQQRNRERQEALVYPQGR